MSNPRWDFICKERSSRLCLSFRRTPSRTRRGVSDAYRDDCPIQYPFALIGRRVKTLSFAPLDERESERRDIWIALNLLLLSRGDMLAKRERGRYCVGGLPRYEFEIHTFAPAAAAGFYLSREKWTRERENLFSISERYAKAISNHRFISLYFSHLGSVCQRNLITNSAFAAIARSWFGKERNCRGNNIMAFLGIIIALREMVRQLGGG